MRGLRETALLGLSLAGAARASQFDLKVARGKGMAEAVHKLDVRTNGTQGTNETQIIETVLKDIETAKDCDGCKVR
jgi:hypothetical protein